MNVHPCKGWRFAPVLATALLASPAVLAQVVASDDRWHYEASPYLWGAGVDGTTRIGGTTVNTSSGFSDLLSNLDFGLMGAFEARRGRWGVLFDGMYLKLSDDATTAQGKAKLEFTEQMYTLGGTWRALEGPTPVDLVAGLRYSYLKPRIEVAGSSVEQSKDTVDPFVGVRGRFPLNERWSLVGYVDVGTYGGSDVAWQILAGADYTIDATKSVKFGYRRLETKYSKDAFDIDTTTHGLYLGMGFRF